MIDSWVLSVIGQELASHVGHLYLRQPGETCDFCDLDCESLFVGEDNNSHDPMLVFFFNKNYINKTN